MDIALLYIEISPHGQPLSHLQVPPSTARESFTQVAGRAWRQVRALLYHHHVCMFVGFKSNILSGELASHIQGVPCFGNAVLQCLCY